MIEFLQKLDWQNIVLTLFAVAAAALVAVWIDRRSRHKRLVWDVNFQSPLLTRTVTRSAGVLEMRYRGTLVTDPWLHVLTFRNDGKLPISANDFHIAPQIAFTGPASILEVSSSESNPPILRPDLSITNVGDTKGIVLAPIPINSGEWFRINIITDGAPDGLAVSGHLLGAQIRHAPSRNVRPLFRIWLLLFTSAIGSFLIASDFFDPENELSNGFAVILGTLAALSATALLDVGETLLRWFFSHKK